MKLKPQFVPFHTGEEYLLVPAGGAGFAGLVRGNETLGVLLELLKDGTDEAEMIRTVKSRYDVDEEAVVRDVTKLLSELRSIGALDE